MSRENPARNLSCSEFEVDNWLVSEFVLRKLVPVVGVHPFPLNELMLMTATTCHLKPSMIFEWGTNIGKSARIFYECVRHYGISAEIHSIDLPDEADHSEHPGKERGKLVLGLPEVKLHQGDGLGKSIEIWRNSARRQPPLFFVDGDHSYDSVARELAGIASEIPDAAILLHDTFFQSEASGYNIGPHRAITKFLAGTSQQYRSVTSGLGLPGMTLLYRPSPHPA